MLQKFTAPIVVLALAMLCAQILVANKAPLNPDTIEHTIPAVRIVVANPQPVQLTVRTRGSVTPRTQSDLVAEVSGKVVWMSPSLTSGGQFNKGQLLLRLDSDDYLTAVARNRTAVLRGEVNYKHALSEVKRIRKLFKQKLASQSQLDTSESNLQLSQASLNEAQLNLEQAQRDLKRTEIYAAYQGNVRSKRIDVGQFISRGESVASLYAIDQVEIRVPIANTQFSYLDFSSSTGSELQEKDVAPAAIHGRYGSLHATWQGKFVRVEGEIDQKTRMFHGIIRVDNSNFFSGGGTPPLIPGLFVNVDISGKTFADIVTIPRAAMRDRNQVLIVDKDNRLQFRKVELLRIQHDEVLIRAGLNTGDRVCISPLQVVVEGMRVNPVEEDESDSNPDGNSSHGNASHGNNTQSSYFPALQTAHKIAS